MAGTILDFLFFCFYLIAKISLLVAVVIFFISGLDDVFFDFFFLIRGTYRRLVVYRRYKRMDAKDLLEREQQYVAVFIPAWKEKDVIGRMLLNTINYVDYERYHLFVGTYPNDEGTGFEVENVRRLYPNVTKIVCPEDGPTNKADNLNWIYQGMLAFEKASKVRFTGVVIHDSEDIIHPLELRLINYLIPRFSMVQIPVYPLESKISGFTAGTYVDDFSENHTKDLLVRERLDSCIPAAGVGCAFSREALDLLADHSSNLLFDTDTLTEDYEFGMKFRELPGKKIFVRHPIYRVITGKSGKTKVKREIIATREFFPIRFWDAVAQRSRWTLGIAIQGWKKLGWRGATVTKLMLYRDRKVLVTSIVNLMGYFAFLYFIADWGTRWIFGYTVLPPLISGRTWVYYLIVIDTLMMIERLAHRAFFVTALFGPIHGVVSILRVPWANLINFFATIRAIRQFYNYLVTGKAIAWTKTTHDYPSEEQLRSYHRKLGDLLLERRLIDVDHLNDGLRIQKETGGVLGEILVAQGYLDEEDLMATLARQWNMPYEQLFPYETERSLLEQIPKAFYEKNQCYPVRKEATGLVVATSDLRNFERLEEIRSDMGGETPIKLVLSSRPDIEFAIRRGYDRIKAPDTIRGRYVGRRLVDKGRISAETLESALRMQKRDNRKLGDILVEMKAIRREELEYLVAFDSSTGKPSFLNMDASNR